MIKTKGSWTSVKQLQYGGMVLYCPAMKTVAQLLCFEWKQKPQFGGTKDKNVFVFSSAHLNSSVLIM